MDLSVCNLGDQITKGQLFRPVHILASKGWLHLACLWTEGGVWRKTTIMSCTGRISVYTASDMWSNAFQTTSASGLSDLITIHLGGHLYLYLTLSTCDLITKDRFYKRDFKDM